MKFPIRKQQGQLQEIKKANVEEIMWRKKKHFKCPLQWTFSFVWIDLLYWVNIVKLIDGWNGEIMKEQVRNCNAAVLFKNYLNLKRFFVLKKKK